LACSLSQSAAIAPGARQPSGRSTPLSRRSCPRGSCGTPDADRGRCGRRRHCCCTPQHRATWRRGNTKLAGITIQQRVHFRLCAGAPLPLLSSRRGRRCSSSRCCCMLTRERTATVSCNLRQPRRCGACMSCSAVAVAPKEHARSLAVRYSRAQRDAQLADLRAPTPLRSGDRHAATPPAIFRGAPRCCSGRGMRVSLCLWRRSVRLLRA